MLKDILAIIGLALITGLSVWEASFAIGDGLAKYYMNNFDEYEGPDKDKHRKVIVRDFMLGIAIVFSSITMAALVIL